MEKVVTITKVQPLKERSYINGNGDNEIFVSRGFVMTDGIDTFYAEATGEYARQLPAEIDTTVCHRVPNVWQIPKESMPFPLLLKPTPWHRNGNRR